MSRAAKFSMTWPVATHYFKHFSELLVGYFLYCSQSKEFETYLTLNDRERYCLSANSFLVFGMASLFI